jgi:hypothetical protein
MPNANAGFQIGSAGKLDVRHMVDKVITRIFVSAMLIFPLE